MTFDVLFAYLCLKVKYKLLDLTGGNIISCPLLRRNSDVIADVILYFDFTEVIMEFYSTVQTSLPCENFVIPKSQRRIPNSAVDYCI